MDVGDRGGSIRPDVAPLKGRPGLPNHENHVFWKQNRWYYHSDSLVNGLDETTRKWFREFLVHGTVWTGDCDNAVHQSQRLMVKPLKSSDWPSDPLGPSWPSFPSIPEWMEMIRKGLDPFERPELKQPEGHLGFTQVSRREVSENPNLATRIVANAVVGIRSSVEVPSKYLKYFRYAHNFLIVTASYALPIGLVRFLLAQWCVNPYSLWLRRAVTFKKFLKKVPIALVKRARLRLTQEENLLFLSHELDSSPLSDASFSDSESEFGALLADRLRLINRISIERVPDVNDTVGTPSPSGD